MIDQYTFYWLTGAREVLTGETPEIALMRAGYGGGAIRALDFYAKGDDRAYYWDHGSNRWQRLAQEAAS